MKFFFNSLFLFFLKNFQNSSKICFSLECWFGVNNLFLQSLLSQFSFFFFNFILSHHSLSLPLWSLSSSFILHCYFFSFLFRFISNHFWFSWLFNVWIASRSPESLFEQLRATPKAYFFDKWSLNEKFLFKLWVFG